MECERKNIGLKANGLPLRGQVLVLGEHGHGHEMLSSVEVGHAGHQNDQHEETR